MTSFGVDELFKVGSQMAVYSVGGIFAAPWVKSFAKDLLTHIDEKRNDNIVPPIDELHNNVIEVDFRRMR